MPYAKRRREQEHERGRKEREREREREERERRLEGEREGQEQPQERVPEQEQEQERWREQRAATLRPSAISHYCICLRSGPSQGRRRTSATPPSSTHTTSITTPEHRLRQQPPHPSHTDSDTSRFRPPIGPSLTSPRDIPSGHDRGTLRGDDTHGPGENVLRPSGSGARFYALEPPAPASLPPPHRPPKVERPSSRSRTTIINTYQTESHYSQLTSNLDNNLINRRGDQPVREYSSTTFHSRMDLDFPDPDLKPTLIRTKQ